MSSFLGTGLPVRGSFWTEPVDFGVFVIEGVGVLSVTAGLDGAFVVRGADVAASLGDVEGTGVVSSESRVSEDVHPVSTRAVAIITPAIAEFLFMLVLSSAQWG